MQSFIFGPNTEHATLEELLAAREAAGSPRAHPTGFPSNVGEGLTFLGQAIGRRMDMNRLQQISEQMRELDPTGEIVRALMEGRQ